MAFTENILHVAVPYVNPLRWRTRARLMKQFMAHMSSLPNIQLHVGEVAFGDRDFEVTEPNNPFHHRFRTRDMLWLKENLANEIISRFPADWQYGAMVDGDVAFTRQDIGMETIQTLQAYDFCQMFSSYVDVTSDHRPYQVRPSFCYNFIHNRDKINRSYLETRGILKSESGYGDSGYGSGNKKCGNPGATGLAWAFRRDAFNVVGGWLDICILGSGDWHAAFGLAGISDEITPEIRKCSRPYEQAILIWQDRAKKLQHNIGYVPGMVAHHFHGSKRNRGYGNRWQILGDNKYDPGADIQRDWQGLYKLSGNKPNLRDGIRGYFASRNEDDVCLSESEVPFI